MEEVCQQDLLNKKYITKKEYVWFALATFASSAVSGMAQGYLLFFYISIMNIPMVAVGTMFLVSKIWDGINDPIMGVIADKTRTKWGKMRPYLIFGCIPFSLFSILLFVNWRGLTPSEQIIYMYATYITFGMLGTVTGVPQAGLPAVVSPNIDERTKMISISRILGSVGEQSALVLISVGLILTKSNYEFTYTGTAVIIGLIAPVLMLMSGLVIRERIEPTSKTPRILDGFVYLFRNKEFLMLILANLLTFFRNLVSAIIIYIVCYIYNNGSLQIAFALPGAIASMLGMLFAPMLKKRFNAKQLFILATIWHSVCLTIVFFVGYTTPWYIIAALMFVTMLPVGILNVVPSLMAADTIDYWEFTHGQRQEGITYSLMGLRSKVASGLKDYFLTVLLAFFLFSQPLNILTGHLPKQSEYTKQGLFMIFTIIPAVLNLTSIIPMFFYTLTGEKINKIQVKLALRREKEKLESGGAI
ncbi:MAG: glycoside-pentoside-hexuronide (GPH):cation symporter [Clostridia bacterium]|nr:glycoside-pentoside-hexuronide (GPH):cation symporter [Clostridia bacterium]